MLGETLWQDVRYAVRTLRKTPVFTGVVLATLIAGIATVTAIFSYANAVYFADLPYKDAERIVAVGNDYGRFVPRATPTLVRLIRTSTTSFERVTAFTHDVAPSVIGNETRSVRVLGVDTAFVALFDLRPMLGRLPSHEEIVANVDVAAISARAWRAQFGADSSVIGKSIVVRDRELRIVGVLPEGFDFPYQTEVLIPVVEPSASVEGTDGEEASHSVLGKVRLGVTRQAAVAELMTLGKQLPKPPRGAFWRQQLFIPAEMIQRNEASFLPLPSLFVGMGIFVLLIACANVANLFLARGAERRGEIAIRASLGASRARLIRQALVEAGLLGGIAAFVGTSLSSGLLALGLGRLPRESWPSWLSFELDWRVALFAVGTLLLVTVAVGLSPALEGTRLDVARALKGGGGTSGATARIVSSVSRALAVQLALAVSLFVCAALLVRSYRELSRVDLGYPAADVATVWPSFAGTRYDSLEKRLPLLEQVAAQLRDVPGISGAAARGDVYLHRTATTPELTEFERRSRSRDERWLVPDGDNARAFRVPTDFSFHMYAVSVEYFDLLELRLRHGRAFSPEDTETREGVTILSAILADRLWPGANPVGRTLKLGRSGGSLTVVGVVDDVYHIAMGGRSGDIGRVRPEILVYVPLRQAVALNAMLLARGAGDVRAVRSLAVNRLREIDPALPVMRTESLDSEVRSHMLVTRAFGGAIGFFASVALALSVIGIYGVVSFGVARRVREIGIRIALGGTHRDVVRHIMGGTARFMAAGLFVGLGLAAILGQFLRAFLIGVSHLDLIAYGATCILFGLVALAASYVPARRATMVDPLVALRAE